MAPKKDLVENQLNSALEKIRKKFGATAATIPGQKDAASEVRNTIACGIDVVDRYIFGIGGAAAGRITELFSEEGGGKTTFSWTQIGAHTSNGGVCIYCDNENSFDSERAKLFGVDANKVLLLQPYTLEEALDMQLEAFELLPKANKTPVLSVWDSVAGAQFKAEMDATFQKRTIDDRAYKLGGYMRQATALAVEKQIHMSVVNQVRLLRGVAFGDNSTTPGGKAIKFAASLRLQLFSGKSLKNRLGQHIGKTVTFFVKKSRFSPPFRKAKVRLYYEYGWDNCWATINHAKDLEKVEKDLPYTQEGYDEAVKALGWENAGPWKQLPPDDPDGVVDEKDEADWAGEESDD